MEKNFSIDEILSAVNEIQNKKKGKKIETNVPTNIKNEFSAVPINTLKLIEEAEKINN